MFLDYDLTKYIVAALARCIENAVCRIYIVSDVCMNETVSRKHEHSSFKELK